LHIACEQEATIIPADNFSL